MLAERDLRRILVAAFAAGTMKPMAAKKYIERLEREAGVREERPQTGDPWGLGIPVIQEGPNG